jgi:hypothetical protein
VRRIEKLQVLVAALGQRDLGHLCAAALVQCSLSSARQYLLQLRDAGIVAYRPGRSPNGVDTGSYCLNTDTAVAQEILESMAHLRHSARVDLRGASPACFLHTADGDTLAPGTNTMRVRRDPLVVALFGEARP